MTSKHYVAITPPPSTLFPGQNFIGMFQRVWVSVPTYCHICIFISWADIYAGTRHSAHARPSCTRVKLAPLSHPLTSHRIMSFIGSDLSQIHRWITRFHRFFNVGSTGCILSVPTSPLVPPPKASVNFQISGRRTRAPSAPERGEGGTICDLREIGAFWPRAMF